MRLVIFDIDGTLTQTMKADGECFMRSLAEVCGFSDVHTDFSRCKYSTDSGVFHEIYESRTGRTPSPNEISRFRQRSVRSGHGSVSIAFAFDGERRSSGCPATGAWRESACLKMASAGLCYDHYPAASSDDAMERESIIRLSIQRATERFGKFDSVVYVGDGVWDACACRNLGTPFIGIATTHPAARLAAEGAACMFSDFTDTELFLRRLHEVADVAL